MSNLKLVIGEKIKNHRKVKGLTQVELGKKANMKHTFVGDVERGVRNISLESLEKILNALEINFSDLFEYREVEASPTEDEWNEVLRSHLNFLKSKNLDDVKMIHRITKDIFASIEKKN